MIGVKCSVTKSVMGLAKYPHTLDVKLSKEMYIGNKLLCRVLCRKMWLLLLQHLKQWKWVNAKQNAD